MAFLRISNFHLGEIVPKCRLTEDGIVGAGMQWQPPGQKQKGPLLVRIRFWWLAA